MSARSLRTAVSCGTLLPMSTTTFSRVNTHPQPQGGYSLGGSLGRMLCFLPRHGRGARQSRLSKARTVMRSGSCNTTGTGATDRPRHTATAGT